MPSLTRRYICHWQLFFSFLDPPIVASTNPCSDTYRGESAGSEVEVQSVTEFISSLPRPLACYVDVHSYGQYWLLPEEIKDMDILQDNVRSGVINRTLVHTNSIVRSDA